MRVILISILALIINASWCLGMGLLVPPSEIYCDRDADCPEGFRCDSDDLCRKKEEEKLPDLFIKKLEVPEILEWGDEFTIVCQIGNASNGTQAASFDVRFYLSKDSTLDDNITLKTHTHSGNLFRLVLENGHCVWGF